MQLNYYSIGLELILLLKSIIIIRSEYRMGGAFIQLMV
jgi:hypothetical protein